MTDRKLRVFLCHASQDKPVVRELYQRLLTEGWIDPWLDEEKLLPGHDWDLEIEKAVKVADVVMVCLSSTSISKEGYIQRELKFVLNTALEKPEDTIFIIPIRLDECQVPRRIRSWQYENYFPLDQREKSYQHILDSLKVRAKSVGIDIKKFNEKPIYRINLSSRIDKVISWKSTYSGVLVYSYEFIDCIKIPKGNFLMGSLVDDHQADDNEKPQHVVNIPYDYWMACFPITNEQYNFFVKSIDKKHPTPYWEDFRDHPVMLSWEDAMNFCLWLNNLLENFLPVGSILRLPTEAEWEKAARGINGNVYPWGDEFDKEKCNTKEGMIGKSTPVGTYSPIGNSPYGCSDMCGNVWEWTHSLYKPYPYYADDGREKGINGKHVLRGAAFNRSAWNARCAFRYYNQGNPYVGFRAVVSPGIY